MNASGATTNQKKKPDLGCEVRTTYIAPGRVQQPLATTGAGVSAGWSLTPGGAATCFFLILLPGRLNPVDTTRALCANTCLPSRSAKSNSGAAHDAAWVSGKTNGPPCKRGGRYGRLVTPRSQLGAELQRLLRRLLVCSLAYHVGALCGPGTTGFTRPSPSRHIFGGVQRPGRRPLRKTAAWPVGIPLLKRTAVVLATSRYQRQC